MNPACSFDGNTLDVVERLPFTQEAREFNDGSFPLRPHENVDERFLQSLFRQQAGVPSSKNYGKSRAKPANQPGDVGSRADHLAGQQRNSKAERILGLKGNSTFEIGVD